MPKRAKQQSESNLPPRPEGFAEYMQAIARRGGKASGVSRMINLTPKQRSTIARKAARARWNKKKPETA